MKGKKNETVGCGVIYCGCPHVHRLKTGQENK